MSAAVCAAIQPQDRVTQDNGAALVSSSEEDSDNSSSKSSQTPTPETIVNNDNIKPNLQQEIQQASTTTYESKTNDPTQDLSSTKEPQNQQQQFKYYNSGSLPRFSQRQQLQQQQAPCYVTKSQYQTTLNMQPRNTMSLNRNHSVRCSINRSLGMPLIIDTGRQSPALSANSQSIANSDTMSINSRLGAASLANHNMLMPSVDRQRSKYNTMTAAEAKRFRYYNGSTTSSSRQPVRTASVLHKPKAPPLVMSTNLDSGLVDHRLSCQNGSIANNNRQPERRYSMNYGQIARFNHGNRSSMNNGRINNNNYATSLKSSPDSDSNLSFKSSIDNTENMRSINSNRFQTRSVNLNGHYGNGLMYSQDYCNKQISDDSFQSARSNQSGDSDMHEDGKQRRAIQKNSMSASTTKVFQSHLSSLKRFFRRPFASSSDKLQENCNTNADSILNESISQICLNRSQSPPICPPPPGELKSMSYIDGAMNYSNYDEFTRARNALNSSIINKNGQQTSSEQRDSWQLTSLPAAYERNLTTLFEERQNSCSQFNKSIGSDSVDFSSSKQRLFIKPPVNFDDNSSNNNNNNNINNRLNRNSSNSINNSSHSLSSSTATADSSLEFHRQAPATPFRFSFAQPISPPNQVSSQKDIGLPPRMPTTTTTTTTTIATTNTSEADDILTDYSNGTNGVDTDDQDATILSDTSTIQGDTSMYANKCAELERTVESLKNKLLVKEKELTDLQLEQMNKDFNIERYRSTISKLEKENAQLKALVKRNNNANVRLNL